MVSEATVSGVTGTATGRVHMTGDRETGFEMLKEETWLSEGLEDHIAETDTIVEVAEQTLLLYSVRLQSDEMQGQRGATHNSIEMP